MKKTVASFRAAKGVEKLTMLTAYDYTTAKIVDGAGIDGILVGDSLGMVMLGYESTIPVTMREMIHHCKAVTRGAENALVVCDMPFLSFQNGVRSAVANAGRLVKEGGAAAVKLEGGEDFAEEIRGIVRASIPVMGHLGLMPQSINALGSYKAQAREAESARKLLRDAKIIEECGAFALILECVPRQMAAKVTGALSIPVIGIGSGPQCDGQILVWQDMLGLNMGHTPKFVRKFAELGQAATAAIKDYDEAVKNGGFPDIAHSFTMDERHLEEL